MFQLLPWDGASSTCSDWKSKHSKRGLVWYVGMAKPGIPWNWADFLKVEKLPAVHQTKKDGVC